MKDDVAPANKSVTVSNDYCDDIDFETREEGALWKTGPSSRFAAVPFVGQSRRNTCVFGTLMAIIVLALIITVSVGNTKVDRKFSDVEKKVANMTDFLHSKIEQLEKKDYEVVSDAAQLEDQLHLLEEEVHDMTYNLKGMEKVETLAESVSQLMCSFNRLIHNNTNHVCCPMGWSLYSGFCYFFSEEGKPWYTARDDCQSKNADLLVLKSAEERRFVVSRTMPLYYWLGLTDEEDQEWKWVDGTTYKLDRSEWMPGQPDNWRAHGLGGGEDCAHFHRDGRYNDDHCSRKYRYVCKVSSSGLVIT
ncbi:asialoglycoprotein receptor 1 [Chanos chanos]|uniref:Asialoglycoprotein receptor 1 n=1 Tax=Chanos chanos TaxID=29144 RepID=A0A6J2VKS5_CHACN|nr:asialoglycoprotein receptor 1-like [Chanos chanos]